VLTNTFENKQLMSNSFLAEIVAQTLNLALQPRHLANGVL